MRVKYRNKTDPVASAWYYLCDLRTLCNSTLLNELKYLINSFENVLKGS